MQTCNYSSSMCIFAGIICLQISIGHSGQLRSRHQPCQAHLWVGRAHQWPWWLVLRLSIHKAEHQGTGSQATGSIKGTAPMRMALMQAMACIPVHGLVTAISCIRQEEVGHALISRTVVCLLTCQLCMVHCQCTMQAGSELVQLFGLGDAEHLVEQFKCKLLQTYACSHNTFTPSIQVRMLHGAVHAPACEY